MNDIEYKKIVESVIKKENPFKNIIISFISGGFVGLFGEVLSNFYTNYFSLSQSDAYLLVFMTYIIIGSLLTGIGVFDKILSICKCGLIVPSTGFANSMTSATMDGKNEGFVKGIGANMFKLTGSIIIYGIIFGILFGFIKGVIF